MFIGRHLLSCFAAGASALVSVGCFGGKNKDVADAPPPPPAAYPDTSGGSDAAYAAGTGAQTSYPVAATAAATTGRTAPALPAPAPFELRQGESLVTHQIASGENLSVIATKYNTTVGRILSANGMTDTRIYAGKSLQVPTSAPPTNLAQNSAPSAPSAAPLAGQGGLSRGAYSSTAGAPAAPVSPPAPSAPASIVPPSASGAIAPPPLPPGASAPSVPSPSIQPPGYPATTSHPRTAPTPPSFDASRVQFSN